MIVTEHGWVTLDWEFVGNNDPLFDLVALHQGLELPIESLTSLAHELTGELDSARLRSAFRAFWLREGGWAATRSIWETSARACASSSAKPDPG